MNLARGLLNDNTYADSQEVQLSLVETGSRFSTCKLDKVCLQETKKKSSSSEGCQISSWDHYDDGDEGDGDERNVHIASRRWPYLGPFSAGCVHLNNALAGLLESFSHGIKRGLRTLPTFRDSILDLPSLVRITHLGPVIFIIHRYWLFGGGGGC